MIPVIDVIGSVIGKVLDKIPDAGKKAELQLEIAKELNRNEEAILSAITAVDVKQAEINAEEAKSSNLLVSGARPFIMWVCGAAFTWAFIFQPIITYIIAVSGHSIKELPELNMSELMPVLLGLLGLGGFRTFEKVKGVQDKH